MKYSLDWNDRVFDMGAPELQPLGRLTLYAWDRTIPGDIL